MKLLVIGRTGQVATALRSAVPHGVDCRFLGRDELDLARPQDVAACITDGDHDAVVNLAAYTAVDRAQDEAKTASLVNCVSVGAMADACRAMAIPLVHLSTDYVFAGGGTAAHRPDDPTGPLGVYGETKLAGELRIRQSGARHAILRTSWVFSATGANFPTTMLRLGAERSSLNVVADQIGGPTPASALAGAVVTIARDLIGGHPGGTYHLSGTPDVSWADFARAIFRTAGLDCAVRDIATSDYPTTAARPRNSRLDCSATVRDFAIPRPDWQAALTELVSRKESAT
ncbi:dTDP-4-dehydrorhamnose reductase [Croceicoccus bisphenolivorans]|uniref:dTDP-4-dehydrorhamnose reductase n=1 Tax=Croceicoccus bisphenolivorans TaxID=1783232 RepID=UPI000836F940|nr:dTDP-4-dehydrorhamnose reductase [Croceicoccus bisphenolivorans]